MHLRAGAANVLLFQPDGEVVADNTDGIGLMAAMAEQAGFDDKMLRRQIAIINSMTKKERANPDMLQASRKVCASPSATPARA